MPNHAQSRAFRFRALAFLGAAGLLFTASQRTSAQNTMPATAVQAARMPQYAKRLAHASNTRTHAASPASSPGHGPGEGGATYDNGPVNGQTDAFTLNFGFAVTDSFQLSGNLSSLKFWAWLFPGDSITNVEVSIGSAPFGSDEFDGIVNLNQSDCFTNGFGYNVCLETAGPVGSNENFNGWVTLQNATVPNGDPVYWDENSGVGCTSEGCPSEAQDNTVGTIPSEAFTITSDGPPSECVRSGGNLQIIGSFTPQQTGTHGGQDGVVLDRAGNLYGAFPNGGDQSAGFVFKLTHHGGWLLNPLFSFPGGSDGSNPTGLLVGPNGSLYGGAQGGIQNCGMNGSQYCGFVFNLVPRPTTCSAALCSWNSNAIYRFASELDGSGFINVSAYDQQGNLYGTTSTGGAFGFGTLFELTPSGGGWTKTTLYSFNPPYNPTELLIGNDGNFYGVMNTGVGMNQEGFVFQLVPSGGNWTLNQLRFYRDGGPQYLAQDSFGNLWGILPYNGGQIFGILKAGSGWNFVIDAVAGYGGHLNNLAVDAYSNLYVTGLAGPYQGRQDPLALKVWFKDYGWYVEELHDFIRQTFPTGGALALDRTSGNLYGTASECGSYHAGMAWQLTP